MRSLKAQKISQLKILHQAEKKNFKMKQEKNKNKYSKKHTAQKTIKS